MATCPLAWGEEVESASWVGAEARTFGYPRRLPRLGHGSCLVSEAHIPPLATPLPLGKTSTRLIECVSLGQVAAQKLRRSSPKGTQRRELDCGIRVGWVTEAHGFITFLSASNHLWGLITLVSMMA